VRNRSTLEIRRITYEDTSASIIERIATKEAVHPMRSLDDLRSRLGSDRRVFSLFHPLLPHEPLVFVHVSLQMDVPGSMRQVMEAPNTIVDPKVATFYSISNAQPGLAGVGLGEFLLKESIRVRRWSSKSLYYFLLALIMTNSSIRLLSNLVASWGIP
jgi:malonyl-CoA decarboxylase